MSAPKYKLMFVPEALEEWHRLDGSIRAPLKKLLEKRLANPHVPGGRLHAPLTHCYKIKLLQQGIRLVYQVEDDRLIVMVLSVERRENGAVYKAALVRLLKGLGE